jgi:hypothetical protein
MTKVRNFALAALALTALAGAGSLASSTDAEARPGGLSRGGGGGMALRAGGFRVGGLHAARFHRVGGLHIRRAHLIRYPHWRWRHPRVIVGASLVGAVAHCFWTRRLDRFGEIVAVRVCPTAY